jgi:Amt family ammonium transporter
VAAYTALISFALLKLLDLVTPVRILDDEEGLGLDLAEHGESAYDEGSRQAIA